VLDVEVVDRALWEKVSGSRATALLDAAERAERAEDRLALLRQAVEATPQAVEPRLRLAIELRKAGSYTEALAVVGDGIRHDPTRGAYFRERGLLLGKLGGPEDLQAAVEALRQATRLEPDTQEFLANLGGALRRLAIQGPPEVDEEATLREAMGCYLAASRVAPYDTYPALNVVRLRLLLSRFDPGERELSHQHLVRLQHLCAYEAAERPEDYWRGFDLADVLLLLGRAKAGLEEYERAVALVPEGKRESELASPLSALAELRDAGTLTAPVRRGVEEAIRRLDAARRVAPGHVHPPEGR
jgi:tetratricopeptide (TPR) repeat protein